jgi:hypothetical protein
MIEKPRFWVRERRKGVERRVIGAIELSVGFLRRVFSFLFLEGRFVLERES